MSLIEMLGGYEKAKLEFENIKNYKPLFPNEVETNERLLLNYRRENNIFEVGDWVIKTHPKNTILWPVLGVCRDGGAWLDYKGYCWKPPRVRHATDEEIKAGHRL